MKAYLITSGAIFGLIAMMHLLGTIDEWPNLRHSPVELVSMIALGLLAAGLSIWAWRLLKTRPNA